MNEPEERARYCARMILDVDGRFEARSENVPADIDRVEGLVVPEDAVAVRALLTRGHGVCRVLPALEGWPAHADLHVDPMPGPAAKRLVSMVAIEDRRLALEEMVSVVAHEVKNPLAGISGALEVVTHRAALESTEAKILEAAHDRVRSLDRTLEDLLLLTRPLHPEYTCADVAAVTREAAEQAGRTLGVPALDIEVSAAACTSRLDTTLTRRALAYMLEHAQSEDPDGARARIEAGVGGITLRVEYRGGDLERDIGDRIFDPRYLTRARRTGLNLPVAARLLRAHRGDVRLEVRAERMVLSACLPASSAPATEDAARAAAQA